jgi:hypothetical protein
MIVGRAIAGIAVGLLSAVVPMYCVRPPSRAAPALDGLLTLDAV